MPLIRVELFDFRMNDETSAKLIAGLTDALCEATTEGLREHTWVIVEGHSPKNWGVAGSSTESRRAADLRRASSTTARARRRARGIELRSARARGDGSSRIDGTPGVIVEAHEPKNWGLGGEPWPVDEKLPAQPR